MHDVECDREAEEWRAVHKMFFEAMRCFGVSEPRAKIMYAAVYHCGPRWGSNQGVRLFSCNGDFMKRFVRRWKTFVSRNAAVELAQLESMDKDSLVANPVDPFEEISRAVAGKATLREDGPYTYITIPIESGTEIDSRAASVVETIGANLKSIQASK